MERKTKIDAEDGKQELVITREFDYAVQSLWLRTIIIIAFKTANKAKGFEET